MDISGVLAGDLAKCTLTCNNEKDGSTMVCDVHVTVNREQAAELFEEEFERLCFESLHQAVSPHDDGDETVWRFGFAVKDPPKWLVGSVHKVDLWGTKSELQPIVKKITAGDKVPAVTIWFRFEVLVGDDAALIGALGCKTGSTVKVKLQPKNPKLSLKARKSA